MAPCWRQHGPMLAQKNRLGASWAVLEASWAVLPRPEGSVVLQRPLGTLQEVVEGSGLGRGRRRGLKGEGGGGGGRKPRENPGTPGKTFPPTLPRALSDNVLRRSAFASSKSKSNRNRKSKIEIEIKIDLGCLHAAGRRI